jgi:hypothetical protein
MSSVKKLNKKARGGHHIFFIAAKGGAILRRSQFYGFINYKRFLLYEQSETSQLNNYGKQVADDVMDVIYGLLF